MSRAGAGWLPCLLAAGAIACAADGDAPPHVDFGGGGDARACDEPHACIAADTSERDALGLRVIHKLMPGEPIASIRLLFDGGAMAWSPLDAHGEAIALLMLQWWGGRAHARDNDFQTAQARIGAQLSANPGMDFGHVSIEVPVRNFTQGFELLASTVNEPIFAIGGNSQAIGHPRGVYRQRFELDDPETAARRSAWELVFTGHPYDMPAAQLAVLDSLSLTDVNAAFDRLRRRERMTLVVAGDVPRARVDALVDRELARIRSGAPALTPLPPAQPSAERALILPYPDAPSWHVYACFPAPEPGHVDYLPLLLALVALDDRLFDALRTERALVYTTGAALADYRVNYGTLSLSTAKPREALAAFHEVLRAAQSDGIDANELDAARAQYTTEFLTDHERTTAITWTLANWQLTAHDRALADEHLRALQDVTAEDATRALATYLPEVRYAAAGAGEPLDEAMLRGTP